jgi:DNA polymerase
MDKKTLLEWQLKAGVDEAVDESPTNYFSMPSPPAKEPAINKTMQAAVIIESYTQPPPASVKNKNLAAAPLHHSPTLAINAARELADNCKTLAELKNVVENFDGCAIKKTATKTVFADGNPNAEVMVIGEAPGAQEDIQGIPFCGASGQLLDKMFLSIGLDRSKIYISNTIFWRPPGNRQPNEVEISICLPFVEKHIALVSPKLLILSGGTATTALLRKDQSISRLRGKLYDYKNDYLGSPVKTALIYHPSYLLRQPMHKKQAWDDLLIIKQFLTI